MKKEIRILTALKTASPVIEAVAILLVAISLLYTHYETRLVAEQNRQIADQTVLVADQLREARRQTELDHEANKRMYTFDVLGDLSENGYLANANYAMVRLINAGALIGVDEDGMPVITNRDKIKPSHLEDLVVNDRELVALLNYYELIGTAYEANILDRDLVLQVRGGPISRAYAICEDYIEGRGDLVGKNLYSNMGFVASEFHRLMGDR